MCISDKLLSLAKKRATTKPVGYKNISDYHDGIYECEFVSPYSKSAHNENSQILVMLQDWISDDVLSGPPIREAVELGRIPSLPTNRNLERLLSAHFRLNISDIYATNLFPYVKSGNMSGNIPFSTLRWAAREFAIPQIKIIQPVLVVAMGLNCFNALAVELGDVRRGSIGEAIDRPIDVGASRVWCQAHTGALGQMGRNRLLPGKTDQDWSVMASWYYEKKAERRGI